MNKLSARAGVVPESQDEVDEMGEADEDGQDEHRLVGGPSCRLLMPESRDDTEHGKRQSESVEHRDAAAFRAVFAYRFQMAVAYAIMTVDVKADEHPEHETYPSVGRQEYHETETCDDASHRHEGHKRRAESAWHVGHGLSHDQYAGTYQRKRQERADARHFASHASRDEGGEGGYGGHADEVVDGRRSKAAVYLREDGRQESVVAHGHKHAALRHEQYENHGTIADEDGQHYSFVEPGISRNDGAIGACCSHVVDGDGHGGDALLSGKVSIVCHASHDVAEAHVEHSADEQGEKNAERHVSFRIARLLCGGADGIEAEESEKHDGGTAEHAAPAKFAQCASVLREIRTIVVAIDVLPADHHKHHDDRHFQEHDDVVEQRTLARAADEEETHNHHDGGSREVDDAAVPRTRRQFMRQVNADGGEEMREILAPRDAHRDGRHGVFQHEVPSDNPGDELAHRGVGISVGTSCHGNHRGKFGIAESGKGASDGGDDERKRDGWTRVACRYGSGDGEESGADDDTDSEGHEADGAEHAAKRALSAGAGFCLKQAEWFSDK